MDKIIVTYTFSSVGIDDVERYRSTNYFQENGCKSVIIRLEMLANYDII